MMRRLSDSSSSDDDYGESVNIPVQQQIKIVHNNKQKCPTPENVYNIVTKESADSTGAKCDVLKIIKKNNVISSSLTPNNAAIKDISAGNNAHSMHSAPQQNDTTTNINAPIAPPTKVKKKPPSPESLAKITGISVNQAPKIKFLKKSTDSASNSAKNQTSSRDQPESKRFCSERRAEDLEKKYERLLHNEAPSHVTTKNPYDLDEPEEYGAYGTGSEARSSPWDTKQFCDLDCIMPKPQISPLSQTSQSSSPKNPAPIKKSSYKAIGEQWSSLMSCPNGNSENSAALTWPEYSNSPHYTSSGYSNRGNGDKSKGGRYSSHDNYKRHSSPDRRGKRDGYGSGSSNRSRNNHRNRDVHGSGGGDTHNAQVQTESECKLDVYTQTRDVVVTSGNNNVRKRKTAHGCHDNDDEEDDDEEEDEDDTVQELLKSEIYKSDAADLTSILNTMSDPLNSAITLIKITLLNAQELHAMSNESVDPQVIAKKYLEILNNCRKTSKTIVSTLKSEHQALPRDILTVINMKLISYLSFNLYQVKKRGINDAKRVLDHYLVGILNKGSKLPESSVVPINVTLALQSYMTTMDNLSKSHGYSEKFEEVVTSKKSVADFLAPFDFKHLNNDCSVFRFVGRISSALQALNSMFGFAMG